MCKIWICIFQSNIQLAGHFKYTKWTHQTVNRRSTAALYALWMYMYSTCLAGNFIDKSHSINMAFIAMKPSNKRRICSAFFSILCNLRPLMMKIIKKKKNILRALICVFDIHFLPRFAFRQSFLSIVFTPCTLSIESMRSYFHQQTWQLEYAMCLGNTHADNWFSRVWVLIKKQKSKWTHSHSTYLSFKFVCFFYFVNPVWWAVTRYSWYATNTERTIN